METKRFTKPEQQVQPIQQVQQQASIQLIEVPSQFTLAFRTPDGDMDLNQYLTWLGNLIYELKKSVVG